MKKLLFQIILFSLLASVLLFSQRENFNWYFYDSCAITFNTPNLEPKPLPDCKIRGSFSPNAATISDSKGNLLFYSGNIAPIPDAWNRRTEIFDRNSTGLIGNKEQIVSYFTAILTYPGKKNLYVSINSVILPPDKPALRIDILDLSKRNGLGDIVKTYYKETHGQMIAAIKHSNNIDWWICTILSGQNNRAVRSYLFTSDGITDSAESSIYIPYYLAMGVDIFPCIFNTQTKSNSALFLSTDDPYQGGDHGNSEVFVVLINFNRSTGKFNTSSVVKICDSCRAVPPIFSPSGNNIYIPISRFREVIPNQLYKNTYELYQCKFSSNYNDIPQTMTKIGPTKTNYLVAKLNPFTNELEIEPDTIWWFFHLKQGPNGKIYILHGNANYISEISNPDAEAKDVVFKDTAVFFGSKRTQAFPWTLYDGYNLWIELSSNSPICYGDSLRLSFSLSDSTKKPQKVVWSGVDSFSSTKQNPSLIPRRSGYYKVTVFVSGTQISDSIWVEVFNPALKIIAPNKFCQGDTIEIKANREFLSYFWSTGDTTKSIKVYNPGKYYLTVVDSNNCIGSDTVFIESDFVPVKIVGSKTVCKGKVTVLEAFPKGNQYSYLWSTGETAEKITVTRGGRYWVVVTNENGCKGTDTLEVRELPQLEFTIEGDTLLCSGSTLELKAPLVGNGYFYLWSTGATTERITITRGGKYWLHIVDENGCEGYDTIDIKEHPKPSIRINADDGRVTLCKEAKKKLWVEPMGNYLYLWSNGEKVDTIEITRGGYYWVEVTNEYGCKDTAWIEIIEHEAVKPRITGDTIICPGKAGQLGVEGDYASYLWSTGVAAKSIRVEKAGTYWVEVTDSNGCRNRAEISVNSFNISLSGIDLIDFGEVEFDSTTTRVVRLQNRSNTAIRIERVKLKHNTKEFVVSFLTPLELKEDEETSFSVSYTSKGRLHAADTIILEVDAPCEEVFEIPLVAKISGTEIYVWLPDTTALVGTKSFCIPLKARSKNGEIENISYEATIGYDATALFPDNPQIPIENGERIINLSGQGLTIGKESTTIGIFCGDVLLARSERTLLKIKKFEWKESGITTETQDGSLVITGICMPNFSQIELFQPTNVTIVPNLSDDQVEITIEGPRNSSYLLQITNSIGMRIESNIITLDNVQKKIILTLADYPSGIYFLRVGNKVVKLLKL